MRGMQQAIIVSFIALTACAATPPEAATDGGMPGGTGAAAASAAQPAGAGAQTPAAPGRPRAPSTPPYYAGDPAAFLPILPPAPTTGDARDEADRRIFRETRALQGTPRWQMAIDDVELGTAAMLKHFSCAIAVEATPQQVPRLVAVLQKASREASRLVGSAKDHYQRKRPFLVDEGATCVPASTIGDSFDYPSGHTTAGWAWALVLAQVDVSNAAPVLARGRAIGDSRVVCGMHNASAVENARLVTGAMMTAISASPAYQADVVTARAELDALRAGNHDKPDAARCALEAQLVETYW